MTAENSVLDVGDASPGARGPWPLSGRIAFRMALVYWILFDNGLELVLWVWPWLNRHVQQWLGWPFERMTLWTGIYVFHLTGVAGTRHPTGSGDTALGWIGTLVSLVVALVAGAVWSAISEARGKRTEYRTLYAWLRLVMRFVLAMALLSYGFEKVFPLQMPPPSAETLAETYGASSPMRLAWTFIGASTIYRIFAGLCEVIPGVLLFFRRTSTIGALGAAAVMFNVFMMNMGYDIPVKDYSFQLLLIALFLLLPDMTPMWNFFVKRRDAALSAVWVPRPERRALRVAAIVLQVAVIGNLLYSTAWNSWKDWSGGRTALHGSWAVDSATGALAAENWTTVRALYGSYVKVGTPEKPTFLHAGFDDKGHVVRFFHDDERYEATGSAYAELHWTDVRAGEVALSGLWNGKPASLTMHRVDPPSPLLMTRGFHWVQEYPFNR